MRFFRFTFLCFLFTINSSVNATEKPININFEQALYEHLQEDYLKAITLSEVLSEKSNHININQQVLLSHSYYQYRLPKESLDLLSNGLNIKVNKADEDILKFHIAKNHYNDQQLQLALNLFTQIKEPINSDIKDELNYLKADIYINLQQLEKAKQSALKLQNNTDYFPYLAHNLTIAYLNKADLSNAQFWISSLNDPRYNQYQNLKDSQLLASGIHHLRQKNVDIAVNTLLQIKKDSSYAAKGLLALGQSYALKRDSAKSKHFYHALSLYPKQNIYHQESLLYLAESDKSGSSKQLFKHAISQYDDLLTQIDELVTPALASDLTTCLVDKINNDLCLNLHLWIEDFEQSKHFQSHLIQNKQLLNIQNTLFDWSLKLEAYEFILQQRKNDFKQKLPQINQQLDPKKLLDYQQQFDEFKAQAQTLKQVPSDWELLNEDESDLLEDIDYIDTSVKKIASIKKSDKEAIEELQSRAQFTKGILLWTSSQQKPTRLRHVTKNLTDIEQQLQIAHVGMQKLQLFNQIGDQRLTRLSQTLEQTTRTLYQLQSKVDQLIAKNKQQLAAITQSYLIDRKATLIHLNSRSKFLLTQLQDIQ